MHDENGDERRGDAPAHGGDAPEGAGHDEATTRDKPVSGEGGADGGGVGGNGAGGNGAGGGSAGSEGVSPKEPADDASRSRGRRGAAREATRVRELEASLAVSRRELAAARAELDRSRDELARTREAAAAAEQRARLDAALVGAGVIDLDAARVLAASEAGEADPSRVVQAMRRRRPYLFKPPAARGGAMAWAEPAPDPSPALNGLAGEARESGDRESLLRYLRARRGV